MGRGAQLAIQPANSRMTEEGVDGSMPFNTPILVPSGQAHRQQRSMSAISIVATPRWERSTPLL
jgi:hypothetical protein